jgi:CGNR zinc finger protein
MSVPAKSRAQGGAPAGERPEPMNKERVLPWLVEISRVDAAALAKGRPGDLPNLLYELRQWLDLEPGEPLNAEVGGLEKKPARLQAIIDRVAGLLGAVADRKSFRADYSGGGVILDAGKLGSEGGRALSYRDAKLEDAVLRVTLDDLYEDVEAALRIQRCEEPECLRVFLAERKNQKYCSHRCANKMASRVYRKTHRKERAERERARYERRVRGRTAATVKIARRPRTRLEP